jgi:hypothetical protein
MANGQDEEGNPFENLEKNLPGEDKEQWSFKNSQQITLEFRK